MTSTTRAACSSDSIGRSKGLVKAARTSSSSTARARTVTRSQPSNLVVPLGFFLGISLGSERPIVELDPYFTWTEFATPGRKLDNDKVSIDKFSAGLTARLYLYL